MCLHTTNVFRYTAWLQIVFKYITWIYHLLLRLVSVLQVNYQFSFVIVSLSCVGPGKYRGCTLPVALWQLEWLDKQLRKWMDGKSHVFASVRVSDVGRPTRPGLLLWHGGLSGGARHRSHGPETPKQKRHWSRPRGTVQHLWGQEAFSTNLYLCTNKLSVSNKSNSSRECVCVKIPVILYSLAVSLT